MTTIRINTPAILFVRLYAMFGTISGDYRCCFQTLTDHGYIGTCLAALTFEYINVEQLTNKLRVSRDYSGLILTSQNAVEACYTANSNEAADILSQWKEKYNYTVGEATREKGIP